MRAPTKRADGSPDTVWTPLPKQYLALSCPINELLFGGSVGGGKTDFLLADFVKHAQQFGSEAVGLLVRRTLPELRDILKRAAEKFPRLGAKFHKTERTWTFPNGATLTLSYLENDEDATRYQGLQMTWVGVDEAGAFKSPTPIDYLKSRMRSTGGAVARMVLTANPGGRGHKWLYERFIKGRQPYVPFQATDDEGRKLNSFRVYIPSRLTDNPHLMKDKSYVDRILGAGPRWLVEALLLGKWDIRLDQGVFKREWWREYSVLPPLSELMHVAQSWDTSFGKSTRGDFSACITYAVFPSGYYILDVWYGRPDFPDLKKIAVDLAAKWQCYDVMVEDAASGQSLIQELRRETLLALTPITPHRDKLARGYATSPLVQSGRFFLPCVNYKGGEEEYKRFPIDSKWRGDFLDNTSAFPEVENDDITDAFTQGANALSSTYVVGLQTAIPYTLADIYKEEYEED